MAVVGSLVVLLGTNNTALTAGLLKAEGQLKAFGATAGTTGAMSGAVLGGIGLAAAAGMGLAVNAAADFESQLNTINTIARLTPDALADVGSEIRALAVVSGTGLPDLTASFYDLLSVGVPLGDAMGVLGNAVNLSLGGLGTVNEAATAITGSINAWSIAQGDANLTLADTARVTDVLATAIELGDIKARDLPAALANIAPQAANFNVSLEEVAASLALMSTKFISPAEGATAMNAAFTALQRVPPGMQTLQDATGKAYEQIARTEGAHSAMMQLVADAEEFNVNLVDVFGRVDALPYVLQTTGAAAEQFGIFLGQALDPLGTAVAQANARTQGFNFQMSVLGASANDLAISIGTGLLPPLTTLVQSINTGVQSVTAWAAANPALSSSLLPVIAGVGFLGAAVALLGLPFVAIIAIIALVITNFDALQRGIQVVIDTITRMIDLAKIGADAVMGIPGVKGAADVVGYGGQVAGAAARAQGGNFGPTIEAATFMAQFEAQNGRRATPLDFAAWQRGGSQPIQINNNTTVVLDGQKVGEINDRRLFNSASQASSGFNRGALEY